MEAHEIIRQVQDTFKKVSENMAKLTGKVPELYRSHGREPKTHNPSASGNVSPVTHYLQYVRQYEASERGAGRMLSNRVHAELEMEFSENTLPDCSEKEFHAGVLKESFDVLDCLNKYDFAGASKAELDKIEEEAAQLRDQASDLVSHIRAIKKVRENQRAANGHKSFEAKL
jgi:hypothetical protein